LGFVLSQEESALISEKFGQDFLHDVISYFPKYSKQWGIDIIEMFHDLSINCIFKGISSLYGDIVLKFYRRDLRGLTTEAAVLSEYNGYRFCKLLDADIENGVLLLECVSPGTLLKNEPSLTKRLDIFLSLYAGLHKEPKNPQMFPTYMQWVEKAAANLQNRNDYQNIYDYMLKASEICAELTQKYPQQLLLHGDFHFENILQDKNGDYRLIDPKGVLGHPLFDLPRYLLNEYRFIRQAALDTRGRLKMISVIIGYFENALCIPQEDIRKSFFIEMALANAWSVESGSEAKTENIVFAEMVMDSY